MSADEAIFDFLTQPENLPAALEVAEYIEQLKRDMHSKFWSTYNPRMDQRLRASEYASSWEYFPHPARRYRQDWGKSYLAPRGQRGSTISQLRFSLGQGARTNEYRLYWGAEWNTPPENFDHPGLTALKGSLTVRNMTTVESHWPGWGWYKYSPFALDFLQRMHREPVAFVDEIVDDVWKQFIELRPLLETVNEALLHA